MVFHRVSVIPLILLLAVWAGLVIGGSRLGDSCWGEMLLEQRGSTKADVVQPFIVAYSGDLGARISCIATQEFSLDSQTTSTLIGGGPGKRYAILSVASSEDTDVDFVVKIFGMRQSEKRVKRQSNNNGTNIFVTVANTMDRTATTMRLLADAVDAVRGLVEVISAPADREDTGRNSTSSLTPAIQAMTITSMQLRIVAARIDDVRKITTGVLQLG